MCIISPDQYETVIRKVRFFNCEVIDCGMSYQLTIADIVLHPILVEIPPVHLYFSTYNQYVPKVMPVSFFANKDVSNIVGNLLSCWQLNDHLKLPVEPTEPEVVYGIENTGVDTDTAEVIKNNTASCSWFCKVPINQGIEKRVVAAWLQPIQTDANRGKMFFTPTLSNGFPQYKYDIIILGGETLQYGQKLLNVFDNMMTHAFLSYLNPLYEVCSPVSLGNTSLVRRYQPIAPLENTLFFQKEPEPTQIEFVGTNGVRIIDRTPMRLIGFVEAEYKTFITVCGAFVQCPLLGNLKKPMPLWFSEANSIDGPIICTMHDNNVLITCPAKNPFRILINPSIKHKCVHLYWVYSKWMEN